MKKFYVLLILVNVGLMAFAAKVTVVNSGSTFSPSSVTINAGDTVVFQLGGSHNAVEVSQATYNANGNTSNGGFSLPFGGGSVKLSQPGTYYYVCTPHAAMGMKGIITVNTSAGIQEGKLHQKLTLYPVLSSNTISVKFYNKTLSKVTYVLVSPSGKVIYQKTRMNNNSGLVEEFIKPDAKLTPGMYVLKVQTSDGARLAGKVFIRD